MQQKKQNIHCMIGRGYAPQGAYPLQVGGAPHSEGRVISFGGAYSKSNAPLEGVPPPNHTPTVLTRPSKWAVPPTRRGYAPWEAYPLPIIQILFRALSSRRSLQVGGAPHLEGNSLQVGGAPHLEGNSLQVGGAPHLEGNSLQVCGAHQFGMNQLLLN